MTLCFIVTNDNRVSSLTLVLYEFVVTAKEQCETLESMFTKMTDIYQYLGEFYCFDINKRPFEDFFGDLKIFLDEYKVKMPHMHLGCEEIKLNCN